MIDTTNQDSTRPEQVGRYSACSRLQNHTAYARVFQPERLPFGFIGPLEGHDKPTPTLEDHTARECQGYTLGFAAIWLHDVPFYAPNFGDVGQVIDPIITAGSLFFCPAYWSRLLPAYCLQGLHQL